jgi:CHAD domain-containing protein
MDENNSIPHVQADTPVSDKMPGAAAWMDRVAAEIGCVSQDINPDSVHDLRVALRRCLSIADVHMAFDPLKTWGEMKKRGRKLFKRLGDLRDNQVLQEWLELLGISQNSAGLAMAACLSEREARLRIQAEKAVRRFNLKKWGKLRTRLTEKSALAPLEDLISQHFAFECWQVARNLHCQALRNRSRIAYHRLRIGLKRFRYTVENFLPQQHEEWEKNLKQCQNLLGEIHDLSVLWRTALRLGALSDCEVRSQWRAKIDAEIQARIQAYREIAMGKGSVWSVWRAGLPSGQELERAAEARIRLWASFRDPEFARTLEVAEVAVQLYDGLERIRIIAPMATIDVRSVLRIAALMRNAGSKGGAKRGGKTTYRRIAKAKAPMGLPSEICRLAAWTARYQRGTIRKAIAGRLAILPDDRRRSISLAAAILCLANALAGHDEMRIHNVEVGRDDNVVVIFAEGYRENETLAYKLAAARYPLELACQASIAIRSLPES